MNQNTFTIWANGEELLISENEAEYLGELCENNGFDSWMEDIEKLLTHDDYTIRVGALFALSKNEEAWNLIQEHKEKINFVTILTTCPFFRINPEALEVYDYMYETKAIQDSTYAYFLCICGKFHNTEFWKTYLKSCQTATEMFELIHSAYNGINPMDIGLIEPNEVMSEFILSAIKFGEKLDDFIIGNKMAMSFTTTELLTFIKFENIDIENINIYANIAFAQLPTETEEGADVARDIYWEVFENYYDRLRIENIDMLISYIKYMDKMNKIADSYTELGHIKNNILKDVQHVISHAKATYKYPATVVTALMETSLYCDNTVNRIDIDNYISIDTLGPIEFTKYAVSAKILSATYPEWYGCDSFVMMYPFVGKSNTYVIKVKTNEMYYISGFDKVFTKEGILESFNNIIQSSETSGYTREEIELVSNFDNDIDLVEFRRLLINFIA